MPMDWSNRRRKVKERLDFAQIHFHPSSFSLSSKLSRTVIQPSSHVGPNRALLTKFLCLTKQTSSGGKQGVVAETENSSCEAIVSPLGHRGVRADCLSAALKPWRCKGGGSYFSEASISWISFSHSGSSPWPPVSWATTS